MLHSPFGWGFTLATEELKVFAFKVRELIERRGLTQAEVARRLGMQASHLNLFLKGKSDLVSQRLLQLLKELDVDVEQLVDEALEKTAAPDTASTETTEAENLQNQLLRLPRVDRDSVLNILKKMAPTNPLTRSPR